MNVPNFRRGIELTSTELNKLSDAVRSTAVTSVIGGTFTRTPGGTTIIVDPQVRGGGQTGGGIPCPFEVTDVSVEGAMKISIAWGLIWQKLPTGMFPNNDPKLVMNISETCNVYSKIVFDLDTLVPESVSFIIDPQILQNTANTQYNLIAQVEVDSDADPSVIGKITNVCQQPFPSPCALS